MWTDTPQTSHHKKAHREARDAEEQVPAACSGLPVPCCSSAIGGIGAIRRHVLMPGPSWGRLGKENLGNHQVKRHYEVRPRCGNGFEFTLGKRHTLGKNIFGFRVDSNSTFAVPWHGPAASLNDALKGRGLNLEG